MPTKSDDEMEESVVKCLRNNKIFKLHVSQAKMLQYSVISVES